MQGRLGISVYPGQAPVDRFVSYVNKAADLGFSRVFTCLISVEEGDTLFDDFRVIAEAASRRGMAVIADVSPEVFERLNLKYDELEFFKDLGLAGIRLDLGFSGMEESFMTLNTAGLSVELNMSNGTKYLENILSYQPDKSKLLGCHNFYPHRYSGLARDHFLKCSEQFKRQHIRTAAFVNAQGADFGPWPVNEGLCTLEEHRNVPMHVAAKDLFATGLIDDVIIANCFPTDEELEALAAVNPALLELCVELEEDIPELQQTIVLEEPHFNRGDVSAYMIRSTQSRVKYKGKGFPAWNTPPIKRGDILIESNLYTRYAGEMQIALRDMENSGRTNVVGRIAEEELFLLDTIAPWQKFRLITEKRGK